MVKIKGFSTKTIKKSFDELIESGLIEKSYQGGLLRNSNAYSFLGKYRNFPNQSKRAK